MRLLLLNQVTVTARLLASHLSGIRHYEKDVAKVKEEKEKANRALKAVKDPSKSNQREREDEGSQKGNVIKATKLEQEGKNVKGGKKKREFEHEEYYLKEKVEDVIESLNMFKNDPLFFKPGKLPVTLTQIIVWTNVTGC